MHAPSLGVALLLAILTLTALPDSARATVLLRLELQTLVARSDAVVRGHVVQQRSRWDKAHRQILTDVEVAVEERYKDLGCSDRLIVRHLGGTVDGIGMRTIGEVSFFQGEEVVLFLARSAGGAYRSVALAQGKLRVVRHTGRAPQVVSDLRGAMVAEPDVGGRARLRSGGRVVRSLDKLAADIRVLAAGPR